MRLAEIGGERLRARGDGFALERTAGFVGNRELGDRAHNRRVRSPRDGLRRRGIAAPREHNAVGQGTRSVGEFVGVEWGRDVRVPLVRGERERAEGGEEREGVGEMFHGRVGGGVMA